jgi:hypothetical protein
MQRWDSASRCVAQHDAVIASYSTILKSFIKNRSVRVRGLGKASGAIGFALTFFVSFFCQEKKEKKDCWSLIRLFQDKKNI